MTDEERKIALYCLKVSSDYHSEVCEKCIRFPNCDHTGQDDVTETIIKELEKEPCEDCISRKAVLDKIKKVCFSREQEWVDFRVSQGSNGQRDLIINFIKDLPSVQPKPKTEVLDKIRAEIEQIELLARYTRGDIKQMALDVIDKYKAESERSDDEERSS